MRRTGSRIDSSMVHLTNYYLSPDDLTHRRATAAVGWQDNGGGSGAAVVVGP